EVVVFSIDDRTILEERGETPPAGVEQIAFAPYIEVGLMLARETRVRQVLGGRAAPDGDIEIFSPALFTQQLIRLCDHVFHFPGKPGRANHSTYRVARTSKRDLVFLQTPEERANLLPEIVCVQESPVTRRSDCEAFRHRDSGVAHVSGHLTEGSVLSSELCYVRRFRIGEPNDVARVFRGVSGELRHFATPHHRDRISKDR